MSIPITDKFKPRNNGGFPLVDAEDVEMPDGTRLGDLDLSKGRDGLTPFIGDNVNWWIGDTDTGVRAQGEAGPQGEQGPQGEKGEKGEKGDPGDSASVTLDTTLTQEGQAADAKAVGDRFTRFNEMAAQIMPRVLPVVTAADNGKFLQVVEGAWAAVLLTDVSEVGM